MKYQLLLLILITITLVSFYKLQKPQTQLQAVSTEGVKDRAECFANDAYKWTDIVQKAYARYEDCFTYKSTSHKSTKDYLKDFLSHRTHYVRRNSDSSITCFERQFTESTSADCKTTIIDTGCAAYIWTGTSKFNYGINLKSVTCKSIIAQQITVGGQKVCCLGNDYVQVGANDLSCHGTYYDGTSETYRGNQCE